MSVTDDIDVSSTAEGGRHRATNYDSDPCRVLPRSCCRHRAPAVFEVGIALIAMVFVGPMLLTMPFVFLGGMR